ncbi:bifunctional diguanylate cyclase/phosphodiesterase [Actinotalea sp. K2]|uniref:putative bifunctional diguanylate cyclase/phosphodiesterase n=1 Tax=Actinotalea sp. K2 TaxID=2939438 RepID=UPI00201758F7|nr:EAL domain-containing protein [Actinotalea sp. K2]MCL3859521.1 EAL domain-containing protein [Actinotalea sp. K2]
MSPTPRWIDLDDEGGLSLRSLADPAVMVDADVTCEAVDRDLRTRWSATSVLVRGRSPSRPLGIIGRDEFMDTMTGQYGYGRALWNKRTIASVADWAPRTITEDAALTEAAAMLTSGTRKENYQDLVVLDADGQAVGILRPTAVMEALADRFARHAMRDQLTGLGNRASFLASLKALCASARADGHGVLVAYIDLDRLKEINDTRGHLVGDGLLRAVGRELTSRLAPGEVVGRLGGDEFAVARPGRQADDGDASLAQQGQVLGETVRAAIAAAGHPCASPASIGVAVTATLLEGEELVRCADQAMYTAKRAGGDRVHLVEVTQPARGATAGGGVEGFVLGVDRDGLVQVLPISGRLEVHFQPIVDVVRGTTTGVEALLRHRDGGVVHGPGSPLTLADQIGMSLELDLWVLGQAARSFVGLRRELLDESPSILDVNLCRAALAAPDLAARVLGVVRRTGLAYSCLRLELPETATIDELRVARPQLDVLRAAGVLLTLDDFGSALTSVQHLSVVGLDGIKIDRWLVEGVVQDPTCAVMVRAMVEVAAALGVPVTAEGVEDRAQLDVVRALGVDDVQGFLIARPMPAEDLRTWLRSPLPWPLATEPAPVAVAAPTILWDPVGLS